MACRLVDDGEDVSLLALFDEPNPARRRNLSIARRMEFRIAYLIDRFAKYGRNLVRGRASQIVADAAASVSYRVKKFSWKVVRLLSDKSNRPIPPIIHSDILALSDAHRAYIPRQYGGGAVLFRALIRDVEYRTDLTLGWKECVTGPIDVKYVPGDHLALIQSPNAKVLADMLVPYLARPIHD